MRHLRDVYSKNRKAALMLLIMIVIILVTGMLIFLQVNGNIKVKQDVFIHEVNTELDQKASTYLENVKDDQTIVNFNEVDTKKLGSYTGTITYEEDAYTIKFDVKDTTKPVLKINKNKYVFALDTALDQVNETINKDITITDNYDTEFAALEVLSELPAEEKELTVKLSIKDASNNKSDDVVITVQFTKDGKEKADLKKEEVKREMNSTAKSNTSEPVKKEEPKKEEKKPEEQEEPKENDTNDGNTSNNTNGGNSSTNNGNGSSGSNGSSGGNNNNYVPPVTPTPQPEPTPTPQPNPTPTVPEYSTPAGCLDGGLFNSEQDANAWIDSYVENPDSGYYHHQAHWDLLSNGQYHAYIFPYQ